MFVRILVLAFLSGAALMTAELAAPRLVAPHLGSSLLTWSAVFGVFLGCLALGNAVGGRIADRGRPRALPVLFGLAGIGIALAIPIDLLMRGGLLDDLVHGNHPVRVLIAVFLAFGPGAFAMGLIAPALGRAVLAASAHSGRALGAVSAATAVGSVFGTFITGFLLIPAVGTRTIYLGAAAVLLACIPMAATLAPGARAEPKAKGTPLPRGWIALAALAGAALLIVEVIAARVAATRLGTSVYTWTSVIGVVLFALGAGNALGGRLADRHEPKHLLSTLLMAASVTVATCLWTPALMIAIAAGDGSWMLLTLASIAAAFFVPAFAIGTLTPVIVRAALTDPSVDGRTVGRLYAVGTAGAVAGSILTGYVLIPLLQVQLLITLLALGLAVVSFKLGGTRQVPWIASLALLVLVILLPIDAVRDVGLRLGVREDAPGSHVEDSRYFHIAVEPYDVRWVRLPEPLELRYLATDPLLRDQLSFARHPRRVFWRGPMTERQRDRLVESVQEIGNREAMRKLYERTKHRMRVLSLDRFGHGFVDLDDPLWLEYEYEILYGGLVRALWPQREEMVRCFFIGGGAYTLQRRLATLHRNTALWTAEIDPAVTRVAREHLGYAKAFHTVAAWDARSVLRTWNLPPFDFVFGDAFHDLGVPWHLTTLECARDVKKSLTPGGVYLVNMIDVFRSGRFLGAMLCTLEAVFEHVDVLSMGKREDHAQETFMLVASDAKLDWGRLVDDDGLPLELVHYGAEDLATLRRRAGDLVLTDDYAPVENLLAPVVRMRGGASER